MDDVVGSARVTILPDMSGFEGTVTSGVTAAISSADKLITGNLTAAFDAVNTQLTLDFDTAPATAAVERALDGANGTIPVNADTAGVASAVDAALKNIPSTSVDVDADTSPAKSSIDGMRRDESTKPVTLPVGIASGSAEQEIARISNAVSGLSRDEASIVIRANVDAATRGLSDLQRQLADPRLTETELRVLLDQHGATSAAIANMQSSLNDLGGTAEDVFTGATAATEGWRTALGAVASLAAGALASSFVQTGIAYNTLVQTSQASFTAVLGSAEAARAQLQEVVDFGKSSPFPRQTWIQATQTMLAFGFASEDIVPTLSAIQDAAAAAGGGAEDISEIARILSIVQSTGKITTETLNQLGERGINAAKILAAQFGVTEGEIRESITDGSISAEDALDALTTGMTEMFGGAAENVRTTWAGATDRVKGAIRDISSAIVTPIVDPAGGGLGVELANKLADTLRGIERDVVPGLKDSAERAVQALVGMAEAGLPLLVTGLKAIGPLLGGTTTLMLGLQPVVEAIAWAIELIPEPLISAAAAMITMNKAMSTFNTVSKLITKLNIVSVFSGVASNATAAAEGVDAAAGSTARGVGRFRMLTSSLLSAQGAVAGIVIGLGIYQQRLSDAAAAGSSWAKELTGGYDLASMSAEELNALVDKLSEGANELRGDKNESFFGRNLWDSDLNAELEGGAKGLENVREQAAQMARQLERDAVEKRFGEIADSLVSVQENVAGLIETQPEISGYVRGIQNFTFPDISTFDIGSTRDLWLGLALAIDDTNLSSEEMEAVASSLGVSVDDLSTFVSSATDRFKDFVDGALSELPAVSSALRDFNDDNKVSASEFIEGLEEDTAKFAGFMGNIKAIADAGYVDVASALAEQGAEAAGDVAQQLASNAKKGNLGLLDDTRNALNEQANVITYATGYVENVLAPDWASAMGVMSSAGAEAFKDGFNPQAYVEASMAIAESGLDSSGQRVAAIAYLEGEAAAREFGRGLNLEDQAINAAVTVGNGLAERSTDLQDAGYVGGTLTRLGFEEGFTLNPSITAAIANGFTDTEDAARTGGSGLGAAARDGFVGTFQILDAVTGQMRMSLAAAEAVLGIRSPSKKFAEIGRQVAAGFAIGITNGADEVAGAFADIVPTTWAPTTITGPGGSSTNAGSALTETSTSQPGGTSSVEGTPPWAGELITAIRSIRGGINVERVDLGGNRSNAGQAIAFLDRLAVESWLSGG